LTRIARASALLALLGVGCFPYRQTYRPAMAGVVVGEGGRPEPDAEVLVCTTTHWRELSQPCLYHQRTRSDAAGGFAVTEHREWEWCCLGEAPLPYSIVFGCARDGRVAVDAVGEQTPPPLRLVLSQSAADVPAPPRFERSPGELREMVRRVCARP
jgi:hypothetical protein